MIEAIERTNESVLTVRMTNVREGWKQRFLFISDAHWDNPHCKRDVLKRHLDQAREYNAPIFSVGDFFCAMQGKFDPRHAKADVRSEHQGNNYLDLLVDTAADWLSPYRDLVLGLADGNHEWSIEKRLETSLTARLADKLGTQRMYEWGFIRFMFDNGNGDSKARRGNRTHKTLYFHHGAGGGGPVTRGVISTNRALAMVADADIFLSGHIHERWEIDTPRVRIADSGRVIVDETMHLCLGTYKDEFVHTGYHTQNRRPPKPIGGYWVEFSFDSRKLGHVAVSPFRTD